MPALSAALAAGIRRDLAKFHRATVTIAPRTGLNDYAEGIYGPPVTYRQTRIEGKVQELRTTTGEVRISTQVVHIIGAVAVNPDDLITLPGNVEHFVLAVDSVVVGDEVLMTRVYL